jgi:hypothetical protein
MLTLKMTFLLILGEFTVLIWGNSTPRGEDIPGQKNIAMGILRRFWEEIFLV